MKTDEINAAIAENAGIVSRDQHGKLYHTEDGYERNALKKELLKVKSAFEENEEQWITRENELMSIIAGKGNA